MKIAFDMSAWLWNSLLTGKDTENGFQVIHKEKPVWINSRYHGYDICMQRMLDLLDEKKLTPIDMIMVFEGANSKHKRLLIDPNYKQGREHPDAAYAEFIAVRDEIKKMFLELGAQAMTQDFAEGDDTLAWLAENMEEDLLIATFDNDLAALNGANGYGSTITVWINGHEAINKYGLFDYSQITTYKALVGDSTDNIKGCVGFGPGKFEKLVERYGYDGLTELHQMLANSDLRPIAGLDPKADPLLHMISDQAPDVIRAFDLAKLRPEWVNSKMHPLKWEAGMVRQLLPSDRDPRLKRWYGKARLVTASSFKAACEWALPLILKSREVALDIEASSAPESDEWLERQGKPDGVDVFGSEMAGMGLTFGNNNQYTLYFTVDHADSDNIASEDLRQFMAQIPQSIPLVIQNVGYELVALYNEWGGRQLDNGFHGFLPNVLDTALEASYVNENEKRGLKECSKRYLGYQQQTYDETTLLTDVPENLPRGGRLIREIPAAEAVIGVQQTWNHGTGEFDEDGIEIVKSGLTSNADGSPVWAIEPRDATPAMEQRRYKMNELTADHVFGYGADDPICTIALHNFYKLNMQLEHQWHVYKQVEIDAAYQHAKNFIDGVPMSVETMNALVKEDDKTFDAAWAVLRAYLIKNGWAGTQPPVYTIDITAAQVKDAFEIVAKRKMGTAMRTVSKLAIFAREGEDQAVFGDLLARLDKEKTPEAAAAFTQYVVSFFDGEPEFNDGSPKQMQTLMYEVMNLPVRVSNKPTDLMRLAGKPGTPKTDALAIAYALRDCDAFAADDIDGAAGWMEVKAVLESLKLLAMVGTRRSLYYSKYPPFMHWKDGRIRSQHNQSATNTRRASEAGPNKQQLPKHGKIEGQEAKFRSVIVPHRPDAVVVSIDFKAQELRVIADYSQDPNMLACYVGDNLKDQHCLTGLGIARRLQPTSDWSYESFMHALTDKHSAHYKFIKDCRTLGKKTNFTTEYGAQAPKLAQTLLVEEEDAQAYIDAKEEMFPVASEWKQAVIAEARMKGFVRTMMGAVRHLRDALMSDDKWEASKAERQAVNFKVQGSSAEMTKMAEGRMWKCGLFFRYDAVCYGPIHDEVVASVRICDLPKFLPEMLACMEAPYANMQVPIMGSISIGLDMYHQVEFEGEDFPAGRPTAELIEKRLAQMYAERDERAAKRETVEA